MSKSTEQMDLSNPFSRRRFVAVDFDSRHLWIVQAEHAGTRASVRKLAEVPIPGDVDASNAVALGEFLGATLKKMKLAGSWVLMCVPRRQAVLKPLVLPPGPAPDELPGMVRYQMQGELPFQIAEAVIDFTGGSHRGTSPGAAAPADGVSLLVAAVRIPVVDHYRQIALAAGVKLEGLGLRPYANISCVNACVKRGGVESVALVHITADETEIDVLVGPDLVFSRSAVMSLVADAPQWDSRHDRSVRDVVAEVVRSLQSYQAMEGGRAVDAVLVAGGIGIEAQVARALSVGLGVPCEVLDPAGAFRLAREQSASAFICPLGLAFGSPRRGVLAFDFIHPKRPVRRRSRARIAAVAMAACVAALALSTVVGGGIQLHGKRKLHKDLVGQKNELLAKNKQANEARARLRAIEGWRRQERDWLAHWAYLVALLPPCEEMYVTSMKAGRDGSLRMSVRATSAQAITELGRRLRTAGYGFEAGRSATTDDPYNYNYTADVRVQVGAELVPDRKAIDPAKVKRPANDDSARVLTAAAAHPYRGPAMPADRSGAAQAGRQPR